MLTLVDGSGSRARLVRAQTSKPLRVWWQEVALLAVLYALYSLVRLMVRADFSVALDHGLDLLTWEERWYLAPERALNSLIHKLPALGIVAAYWYTVLHFTVTPAVLIWLRLRHARHYSRARTILLSATLMALVGYALYPTAPPRMLDGRFTDTLVEFARWGFWGTAAGDTHSVQGFTNQLAAMPSMHVGWAVWCGWYLARYARRRIVRVLGAVYPVITIIVVMATANHYLLDAVAGIGCMMLAAAGYFAASALRRRRERPLRGEVPHEEVLSLSRSQT